MSVSLTHAFTSGLSDGSTAYTGTFTSGTNTITSVSPTPPATGATGWKLFGGPVAAGATIASVSGSTITMSANATGSGTGLTFYSGDGQVQSSDWNAQHTLTLAQGNVLGRLDGAGTGAATEIPLSFDASNNATFPATVNLAAGALNLTAGAVNLAAGTTTIAPLDFTSGTNLTTANAGAMEYDGKRLMFTPLGTQRGIVPGMQYYRLDTALAGANVNTVQNIIGVGCTLSASTVYAFECLFVGTKTTGTTSHSINFGFGGTATLNNIGYFAIADNQNSGLPVLVANTADVGYINTATLRVLIPSSASATLAYIMRITGTVSVNAGGTFIPQYSCTAAPGGAYTTAVGSYMAVYPLGASGANTNVGTWA